MRRMTIVLCIFSLLAGSTSAEMWKDDFDGGELGEDWTSTSWCGHDPSPNWKIEDGILRGKWPHWNAQMLFLPEYPSLDYTIQVKCRIDKIWQMPSLAGAGFIFRSSDPEANGGCIGPFYEWGISSNRCGFMISAGMQIVGTVPERYDFDQWYTLKLVVKGKRFLGYVNDEFVCKLSHDTYKGKFVGLMIGANIDASFDDFMITDQVDEDAFINFDVSPEGTMTTTWAGLKTQ